MYPPTLLAHFCSLLFGLTSFTNATPFFLIHATPTIIERDLIGLLVGGNGPPEGGATPPSSLGSVHTPTVSAIETSRLRTYSLEPVEPNVVTTPVHATPASTTKPSIDTAFLVQTSPVFLPEDPSNLPPSSNPISTGSVGDTSITPPAELTEWKVIGICVTTVTLIGILVLSISFFDSWWGFLRSVTCGRKNDEGEGKETMVPDEERLGKSWEFELASEDGHRYPTLSSMESIQKKGGFL